jgi:VWFA-related protein
MKTAGFTALALFTAAVIYAQITPAQSLAAEDDAIFRSDTRLVEVHATVADQNGKLLTDLPQSAFHIYEDGVEQQIKVFRREDAPISLGLIIDNSASMGPSKAKVAAAALALVRASNSGDEVFIMKFDDKPALVQDFTHDTSKMEAALSKFDPTGATAMRDGILLAAEHLKRLATNDKKVLLVVTDGEDNASIQGIDRIVRIAQQNEILVYAIGLLTEETPRSAERAKRDLDALTSSTGGEVFYPQDLSEIDGIANHVAHDLRNQYTIAYNPPDAAPAASENTGGTFRQIKVTVDVPGAKVEARSGYYADRPAETSERRIVH